MSFIRSVRLRYTLVTSLSLLCVGVAPRTQAANGTSLLREQEFLPATMCESGQTFWDARANRVEVFADRYVYFADDVDAQFLVAFLGRVTPENTSKFSMQLELKDVKSGQSIESKSITIVRGPKLPVIIPTSKLKPGQYELAAMLKDTSGNVVAQAARTFERSAQTEKGPTFPSKGISISPHAQSHVPDGEWPISTGVPMPKGTLKDVGGLALLENGKPVPAQFIVRATWSPNGWVKWIGVDFVARYDKGKPREYRLVQSSRKPVLPARPLSVEENAERIIVNTGAVKFEINRKQFAGIEKAWIGDKLIVDGSGGSFVVDEKGNRYESARSKDVQVVVEESGPVQTTIAAKGWYGNEKGEQLCKFVIRLKAYAGQPFVMVSHRTVNTIPDQYVSTRLADVGFEVVPSGHVKNWRYGFDGKANEGTGTAFLHQDRADHFRLMQGDKQVLEGKRSDGWMTATATNGSITYFLRDVYQKFPKELELDLSPDAGRSKLVAHFWPKHGHKAFTDEEEIARDQIYKVRYAHEGKLLDMLIPLNYHQQLEKLEKEEGWAGGDAQLVIVDNARNLTKMQAASGQGTVIGNDLIIRFDASPPNTDALRAHAALMQQSPHAMADAKWNCDSGALGPLAARDPVKFGPAEKLMDTGYEFYRRSIIDAGDEYGMWIYGAVHSSWVAGKNAADLKRVWQQSHYQNVFQAWMLYFRSGSPESFDWARIHSGQHIDVGVCNYRAYPPGKHSYSNFGDIGGDIYHCKGFMPWAGNSSTWGHWIDIGNYFLRYYMTGDRRGLDMAETWMQSHYKVAGSNAANLPTNPDGYQNQKKRDEISVYIRANPTVKKEDYPQWMKDELAKPQPFNPREVFVPLGEMTLYYEATWNPQSLIYLNYLAEHLNPPFESTESPTLATFGKHWQDWYYGLTRDPRVIDRVRGFLEWASKFEKSPGYDSFAAFLYHTTGDTKYLKPIVTKMYDQTLNIYECEGDRYHGFCLVESNPSAMLLGRLPYFLHAVDAAGLKFERSDASTVVPTRGGRYDTADKWLTPPRGWSNTGVTLLTRTSKSTKLAVSIDPPRGYGDAGGFYQLFYGFPELNFFDRPNAMELLKKQNETNVVKFPAPNLLKDPPEQRNYREGRGDDIQYLPYVERPDNDPSCREYRLENGGSPLTLPVFLDAESEKPLPQVAVIARTMNWNLKTNDVSFYSIGVTDAYFRPLDDKAVIQLKFISARSRYWQPTKVRITDGRGKTVLDSSVFMAGQRKEVSVTLDPVKNPLPWRMLSASSGDYRVEFTGADELFFARKPEEFGQILPHIPIYSK